jgi:hypothetical protein
MAVAYAFALQALLGAVLTSEAAAADPLVICYASQDGNPVDHGSGKSQQHETCVLCTLAHGSHAILGADHATLRLEFTPSAIDILRTIARVIPYESPTGQYQRGPPAAAFAG